MASRAEIEAIATSIVDSAYRVHSQVGPGLLESAYHACLNHILTKRGHSIQCEVLVPLIFDGVRLDAGYRADLIVDGLVIVEHKTVQALAPVHFAQLRTYLRLSDLRLGLLINWNVVLVKDGIKRVVNGLEEPGAAPPPNFA